MLIFVNTTNGINKQPGWDSTVWARYGSGHDMAHENNENKSGQRDDVSDAIVSGSLKCHISFMRPVCMRSAFLNALEEYKLTNSHYFESSHHLEENWRMGERMGDVATANGSRGRTSP